MRTLRYSASPRRAKRRGDRDPLSISRSLGRSLGRAQHGHEDSIGKVFRACCGVAILPKYFLNFRTGFLSDLWPISRSVPDAKNLYLVFDDFVNGNVRPPGEHQFTGTERQTEAAAIRKCAQGRNRREDRFRHLLRCCGFVLANALDDTGEVRRRRSASKGTRIRNETSARCVRLFRHARSSHRGERIDKAVGIFQHAGKGFLRRFHGTCRPHGQLIELRS